jgi:hypothetical protein
MVWFDYACLETLARRELNGRQIKNAVRTADAFSVSRKELLASHHLVASLNSITDFDVQFEEVSANVLEDTETSENDARYMTGKRAGKGKRRPRLF